MIIITVLEGGKPSTVEFPLSIDIKDAARDFWEICEGGPLFDKAIEYDEDKVFFVTDHVLEAVFEKQAQDQDDEDDNSWFLEIEQRVAPRHHGTLNRMYDEHLNHVLDRKLDGR